SGEGVAVQTTFRALSRQLETCPRRMFIGLVKYINYHTDLTPAGTPLELGDALVAPPFAPYIYKRRGFGHEKEVRIVFQDSYATVDDTPEALYGIPIEINIEELVTAVYLAPGTKSWLRDVVQAAMNKFGLSRAARASEFDATPPL